MWILLDGLSDMEPESQIVGGEMVLEDLRLLSGGGTALEKYVCISGDGEQTVLTNSGDAIIISGRGLFEVINRVIEIFEDYRRWDAQLHAAMETELPFQELMDAAHRKFQCPMLFGNVSRRIFAITRQYSKDEVYEEWDEVKALSTMPYHLIERLWKQRFTPGDGDGKSQAVEPVWEGMHFRHQIRTNCYYNGAVWGHLYLYYGKEQVSPSVLQLAAHVAGLYEQLIKLAASKNSVKSHRYSWLVDILDRLPANEDAISTLLRTMGWDESDELLLYKIATDDRGYDQMMFYWLCDSIAELSRAIVFPYDSSIVVIVRRAQQQAQYVLERISRMISFNSYHCGISFSFRGLSRIGAYYRQAGCAIASAPDSGGKLHYYRDCMLEGMISEIRTGVPDWREGVRPELAELRRTDERCGRDYYETLRCYLLCDNNISAAAARMHLHRNTLVYRLNKIREALGTDIDGNAARAYLLLCFLLLGGDR